MILSNVLHSTQDSEKLGIIHQTLNKDTATS